MLEIVATEPETDRVLSLPLRFPFSPAALAEWVRPHTTTVIDIELLRLPGPDVFRMARG